jgi:WD40 repeat protein
LMIWDMESGDRLQSFTGFRFGVPRFAFSPDGSVLAAGEGIGFEAASPSGLRLFDLTTGREIPMLTGHEGVILNVAFSPNGRLLATASEDKTIRLWGVPPQAAP